jgi:hypothetical protein
MWIAIPLRPPRRAAKPSHRLDHASALRNNFSELTSSRCVRRRVEKQIASAKVGYRTDVLILMTELDRPLPF